ncbi:MAG TPA: ribosome-associated translation inhibitor RaiA [Bacillota bacterium]|nr:ribosome-associated translation inhibitor RaiA [Bacillota bacterium]
MQTTIFAKNIDLTPALRAHAEKKLAKLDRYFDVPLQAQVVLSVEKARHIVEVTIPIDGWILRGQDETDDMYVSVDHVVDKLERQVHKYKTRLIRKPRSEPQPLPEPAGPPEAELEVVRVKRFNLKPIPVTEAALQMQLLGHDFFVFRDADQDGVVAVVYRRRDGRVGLIEPEA